MIQIADIIASLLCIAATSGKTELAKDLHYLMVKHFPCDDIELMNENLRLIELIEATESPQN